MFQKFLSLTKGILEVEKCRYESSEYRHNDFDITDYKSPECF